MYNYSNVSLISRNLCKFLLCLCTLYCLNQNIAKIITAARLNAWHTRARHDSLWRRHVFRRTLNGHVYLGGLGSCLPATKPDSLSQGHNKVGLVRGGHNARALNHCGSRKVPTMLQTLSSTQDIICSRKTVGSNMGAPNLFLSLVAI